MTATVINVSFAKDLWPSVKEAFNREYSQTTMEKTKVYFIKLGDKRFNSKKFDSYESARKYVRKIITKRFGKYSDSIGEVGFSIDSK